MGSVIRDGRVRLRTMLIGAFWRSGWHSLFAEDVDQIDVGLRFFLFVVCLLCSVIWLTVEYIM